MQTLETPTEATGSPSEGTDPSWALFHLGARLTPPGLLLSQKNPLTPPFRLGEEAPFRFRFLGARRANHPGLGLPPVDSSPPSARRLPQSPAGCLGTPPPPSSCRRRRRTVASLRPPPPPSGRSVLSGAAASGAAASLEPLPCLLC
ncbi:hypothetical protein PVAP13_9NG734877 [Panicum virgatum]|uniref:Uncharacterized protein n=1 Tax=Panicum virgatum TaxID=38727 RepID=A0A8T0N556_PANVG|nr:hypothetical protein PVAP13_9NG734877 [Panicum virgatum]